MFGIGAGLVLVFLMSTPFVANAILATAPPRIIATSDVTTAEILDGTILGVDISESASTTMLHFLVGNLSATGTIAFPANSITDEMVANTITLDNITQITSRAISDTTGTLTVARGGTGSTTPSGLLYGDSDGLILSVATGTNTQVLTGNASGPPTFQASPSPFNTLLDGIASTTVFLLDPSDLTSTVQGGASLTNLAGIRFQMNLSLTNDSGLALEMVDSTFDTQLANQFDRNMRIKAAIIFDPQTGNTAEFGFGNGQQCGPTHKCLFFRVIDSTLSANAADGTTLTQNTITGIDATELNIYEIDFTTGGDTTFIINGTTVATFSTTTPTGASQGNAWIALSIFDSGTDVDGDMFVYGDVYFKRNLSTP